MSEPIPIIGQPRQVAHSPRAIRVVPDDLNVLKQCSMRRIGSATNNKNVMFDTYLVDVNKSQRPVIALEGDWLVEMLPEHFIAIDHEVFSQMFQAATDGPPPTPGEVVKLVDRI